MKPEDTGRRELLKGAVGGGVLAATATLPSWIMPALAQGEELVPFTDVPESFQQRQKVDGANFVQDTRNIDSFYSSFDQFYVVQHYGQPELDPATHRVRVTGMVDNPMELSMHSQPQCRGDGHRV